MSVCQYDAAVFAAYGWPATLSDAEILERLGERAAEVTDLLETLSDLGHVTRLDTGRYGGH